MVDFVHVADLNESAVLLLMFRKALKANVFYFDFNGAESIGTRRGQGYCRREQERVRKARKEVIGTRVCVDYLTATPSRGPHECRIKETSKPKT